MLSQPDKLSDLTTVPKYPPGSETFMPEPLIDSDQAAAIMHIHPKTLQKLARRGEIRGVQIGKIWRFRASVIEHWIQHKLTG